MYLDLRSVANSKFNWVSLGGSVGGGAGFVEQDRKHILFLGTLPWQWSISVRRLQSTGYEEHLEEHRDSSQGRAHSYHQIWARPGSKRIIFSPVLLEWVIAQLCPALCNPMGYGPPKPVSMESGVRILGWVTIFSSRDLADPGPEHRSPAPWADSLPSEPQSEPEDKLVIVVCSLPKVSWYRIAQGDCSVGRINFEHMFADGACLGMLVIDNQIEDERKGACLLRASPHEIGSCIHTSIWG